MKRRILTTALSALALAGLLAACDTQDQATPEFTGDDVTTDTGDADTVAIVNGEAITRADLFAYAGMDEDPGPAASDGTLEEVISLELLRQEAVARGLDTDAETRRILRMVETNLLASLLMERITAELDITQADLEAEYDRQIEQIRGTEYRARHILVEEAERARELLEELEADADFAELAEAHSTDPGSAARGGELGWFAPEQMVPAFSEAAMALEPGETTAEPVESRFGWHIIRLEETRDTPVPELEDVRAELIEILESRAIQEYLEALREDADVEIPTRPANQ
ncbi:peptidylprolyl isomerase [Thioalkalivibrio versutus]|uniref:peptidylprolyl isomerase n=1 Tax=Thioalkalivibrio versutus TaxID=106634 RepID=UPI00035E1773|nr:peptidylprolyl isomerase [Thioalkalivibrio versutus]OOC47976.1 peptidylprolyl isomerase [Thioalkalivibrio versutus]